MAVVVVVGVAVLANLPTHATATFRRGTLRSYLSTVGSDVAQCQAGLRDAVTAYVRWAEGLADASRTVAATFSRQAASVCSFANENIDALASLQPPRSIAAPAVEQVTAQVGAWAYHDAFTLEQDLSALVAQPHSTPTTTTTTAAGDASSIDSRRARVEALIRAAERHYRLPNRAFHLVEVRALLPHGSWPSPRATAP